MQSWNVAVVNLGKIESLLVTGDAVVRGDVILFQEVQRGQPGWSKAEEFGDYVLVKFQGHVSWRGVAIAVNRNKFAILRKKACEHGLWMLVEDQHSGQRLWLGSCYLSTGVPMEEYQVQYRKMLELLPPTSEASILGGDLNVALCWARSEAGESVSLGSSAKLRGLKTACSARRLELLPQQDIFAKTHVSRKDENIGGQIDGMFCSRPGRCSGVRVEQDSRKIIGSDHEVITCRYLLEPGVKKSQQRRGGIRVLQKEVTDIPVTIDQQTLETMAKELSSEQGCAAPADGNQAPEGKAYMAALRKHRSEEQSKKLEEASANWQMYRRVRREGKPAWSHEFAAGLEEEPLPHIRRHFQEKFEMASWG